MESSQKYIQYQKIIVTLSVETYWIYFLNPEFIKDTEKETKTCPPVPKKTLDTIWRQ